MKLTQTDQPLTKTDKYWHSLTTYCHLLTLDEIYWHWLTFIDTYWHLLKLRTSTWALILWTWANDPISYLLTEKSQTYKRSNTSSA